MLLGIVSDGDRAIALLRKKCDRMNYRAEVGNMLSGWRVSKVVPKSVLLERKDDTSMAVPLFNDE